MPNRLIAVTRNKEEPFYTNSDAVEMDSDLAWR